MLTRRGEEPLRRKVNRFRLELRGVFPGFFKRRDWKRQGEAAGSAARRCALSSSRSRSLTLIGIQGGGKVYEVHLTAR